MGVLDPNVTHIKGSNNVEVEQIVTSQSISGSSSLIVTFDLQAVAEAVLYVDIDQTYSLTFYPMVQEDDSTLLSIAAESLASSRAAPAAGRADRWKIGATYLPAHTGRILLTNNGGSAATADVYLLTVPRRS